MKASFLLLAAAIAVPAFAQTDASCIVAGRLSEGAWAPRFDGVHLFSGDGNAIVGASKASLASVRRVTLDEPALLSRCDGSRTLLNADNEPPGRKGEVPALARGSFEVEGVAYPKLQTGGELVELRVRAPAQQVVMITR